MDIVSNNCRAHKAAIIATTRTIVRPEVTIHITVEIQFHCYAS